MSPYIDDATDQRYVKRLNEVKNWNLHSLGKIDSNDRSMKYEETQFFNEVFGWKRKSVPDVVEVYRGVSRADAALRPGDFVTLTRRYARSYIRGKKGAILRHTVPSEDLIVYKLDYPEQSEFIYYPKDYEPHELPPEPVEPPMTFRQLYEQVNL